MTDRVFYVVSAAVTVVFLALVFVGVRAVQHESCEQRAAAMGREWRYGFFSGCLVRVSDGTYVPLDNYRTTNEPAP